MNGLPMLRVATLLAMLILIEAPSLTVRHVRADEPGAPSDKAGVSFVNDVVPILTRHGCNAGSCHGAARGKDGFCLLYTSPSPRDQRGSRMPSSA